MTQSTIGKTTLSSVHLGSCISYKLCGNEITVNMLGLVPIRKIRLADIRTLRLASRKEVPRLVFALNWMLYYLWHPAYRPIYFLQTVDGKRYFPRLSHLMHKQLLLAMKRDRSSARAIQQAA